MRRARADSFRPLRLEPFSEEHFPGVVDLFDDPDVLRFTLLPVPVPEGFEKVWLARYVEGRRDGTREAFAAVDDDGTFLGLALAPTIDREGREAELGYVVVPAARGRGVATEMLRRLTRWALDDLGLLRLELVIDAANPASKRVAEHCGYEREGIRRSVHLKNGIRIDAELWALLVG
jgi:RimJ/RimL family protein N-acetyltransferase